MRLTLREAWRGYLARRYTGWVAMGVSALLLGIFGVLLYTSLAFTTFLQQARASFTLDVYATEGLPAEDLQRLARVFQSITGVERVEYFDRKRAKVEFLRRYPQYSELFSLFEEIPFPDRFRIYPKPHWRKAGNITYLRELLSRIPGVEDVYGGGRWLERLERLSSGLLLVDGVLLLVVFLALSLVIFQTLRLTVMARQEVVHLMLLLGATPRMVRAPFELLGVVYAGLGSGLSLILLLVFHQGFQHILGLSPTRNGFFALLAGLWLFGVVLGWLASRSAMDDLLAQELPEL